MECITHYDRNLVQAINGIKVDIEMKLQHWLIKKTTKSNVVR